MPLKLVWMLGTMHAFCALEIKGICWRLLALDLPLPLKGLHHCTPCHPLSERGRWTHLGHCLLGECRATLMVRKRLKAGATGGIGSRQVNLDCASGLQTQTLLNEKQLRLQTPRRGEVRDYAAVKKLVPLPAVDSCELHSMKLLSMYLGNEGCLCTSA